MNGTARKAHTTAADKTGNAAFQSKNCSDTTRMVRSHTVENTKARKAEIKKAESFAREQAAGSLDSRFPQGERNSMMLIPAATVGAITQLAGRGLINRAQNAVAEVQSITIFSFPWSDARSVCTFFLLR